jgi:hypothetical protein
MLWNLLIQIGAGIIGRHLFTFEFNNILSCLILTGIVQLIGTIKFHNFVKRNKPESISDKRNPYFYKLIQLFLVKLIFYTLITLVSAYISRQLF